MNVELLKIVQHFSLSRLAKFTVTITLEILKNIFADLPFEFTYEELFI